MKISRKIIICTCFMLILSTGLSLGEPASVSAKVKIKEASSKIKLNKTKVTLNKGQSITLRITGTDKKVKWSSSKKSVATVSAKGKVKAKKNGTSVINAKVGGNTYKCKVKVKAPKLNKSKFTINIGETCKFKVSNTTQNIKWSSSKKSVAKVNAKGKVTGIKSGTATITAKVGSIKLKGTVKVNKSKKVSFKKKNVTVEVGDSFELQMNNLSSKDKVTYFSDDEEVVAVKTDGTLFAYGEGTTKVTAYINNKDKCTCTVKVHDDGLPHFSAILNESNDFSYFGWIDIVNYGKYDITFGNGLGSLLGIYYPFGNIGSTYFYEPAFLYDELWENKTSYYTIDAHQEDSVYFGMESREYNDEDSVIAVVFTYNGKKYISLVTTDGTGYYDEYKGD